MRTDVMSESMMWFSYSMPAGNCTVRYRSSLLTYQLKHASESLDSVYSKTLLFQTFQSVSSLMILKSRIFYTRNCI